MSSKKPKTSVIAVRVSIEQREAIEKAAVTAGASVSGFIAATMGEATSRKKAAPIISAAPPMQVPPPLAGGISLSDPTALAELRRIGININQLAHAANAGYPPNVTSLLDNLKRLFAMLSEPDAFKRHVAQINSLRAPSPPTAEPRARAEPVPPAPPTAQPRSFPPGLASLIEEAVAARTPNPQPVPPPAPKHKTSPPRLPPRPKPQQAVKDDRRAPQHPQARNQLQSRPELRPARSTEGDHGEGRLGFLRKLWDR